MAKNLLTDEIERAVIVAAGRGRRLRPYTDTTPKPLLPINGRPTLDYILTALSCAGVGDVCLVTHYLGEQIAAYVGNGARWGLRVVCRRQARMVGAGDAVRTAVDFITGPAFVLAADYALPPDYLAELARARQRAAAPLAVSLKQLAASEVAQRSSVCLDEYGRVLEIVEKPAADQSPSTIGASFIFIVPPAVRRYLHAMTLSPRGEYEFQDVINHMVRDGYELIGLLQSPPLEWLPDM